MMQLMQFGALLTVISVLVMGNAAAYARPAWANGKAKVQAFDDRPSHENHANVAVNASTDVSLRDLVLGRTYTYNGSSLVLDPALRSQLTVQAALPPGIQKQLARGKSLPPGIAKNMVRLPERYYPALGVNTGTNVDVGIYGRSAIVYDPVTNLIRDVLYNLF